MVLQRLLSKPAAGRRLLCHHNDAAVLSAVLTGASTAEAGAACNKVPFNAANLLHSRVHTTNAAMHASTYDDQDNQARNLTSTNAQDSVPHVPAIATYLRFLRANHPQLLTPAPATELLEQGRAAASAWKQQPATEQIKKEEHDVKAAALAPPAKASPKKASKKTSAGKINSWNMFVKHHVAINTGAQKPTIAELSKQWKALSEEGKRPFVDMAATENVARASQN